MRDPSELAADLMIDLFLNHTDKEIEPKGVNKNEH
jgi:hypothetical protein